MSSTAHTARDPGCLPQPLLPMMPSMLLRRHEQMKKNLEAQHKELEEKRRQLEDEKNNWEAQQRVLEQQKLDSSRTLEKNKKKKIF
eukprot:XP_013997946.1 PREDICTED: septin-7-like isoform X1 [Salmo salar]